MRSSVSGRRGDILSPPSPPPSPLTATLYSPTTTFATPLRNHRDHDDDDPGDVRDSDDPFSVPVGVRSYLSRKQPRRVTAPDNTTRSAEANGETFYIGDRDDDDDDAITAHAQTTRQTFERPQRQPKVALSPVVSLSVSPAPPPPPPPPSSFGGFVSGRGRVVSIAAESLAKAKRIFDENDADVDDTDGDGGGGGTVESLLANTRTHMAQSGGGGFSTARGSAVTISASSRRRAEALLREAQTDTDTAAAADADADALTDTDTVARSKDAHVYTHTPLSDVTNGADTANRDSYKRRRLAFTSPRLLAPGKRQPKIVVPQSMRAANNDDKQTHTRKQQPAPTMRPVSSPSFHLTTPSFSRAVNVCDSLLRLPLPLTDIAGDADAAVMRMDSHSALLYKFQVTDDNGARLFGWSDMRSALLRCSGVDSRFCSRAWAQSHWRFLVWKFAAYQRVFGWRCLTMNGVLRALHKRYDREVNECRRSALRLILERDESPSRHLVLLVATVWNDVDQIASDEADADTDADTDALSAIRRAGGGQCHVEVSDGHYSVPAQFDADLVALLRRGRIFSGMKLRTFGCQLGGGDDEATTPLENSRTFLRISYNSTRPAAAHTRLGFQRETAFFVRLNSAAANGGIIPAARVVVTRVYPLMFMETASDGSRRHRNQRGEDAAADRFASEMEKLSEIDNERRCDDTSEDRGDTEHIESDNDSAIRRRNVTPYLRMQVVDYDDFVKAADAPSLFPLELRLRQYECCIWRPTEYQLALCTESAPLNLFAIRCGEFGGGNVRFSLGAKDILVPITEAQTQSFSAIQRRIIDIDQLVTLTANDMFDSAVVVLAVTPIAAANEQSNTQRRHNDRRIICCAFGSDLLVIDVVDSIDFPLISNAVTPLSPLLCRDLTYTSFDQRLRVHNARTTNKSAFIISGGQHKSSSAASSLDEYRRFIERSNTPQCKRIIELQKRRAEAIVSGRGGDEQVNGAIASAMTERM